MKKMGKGTALVIALAMMISLFASAGVYGETQTQSGVPSDAYIIEGEAYNYSGIYWFRGNTDATILAGDGYTIGLGESQDAATYSASLSIGETTEKTVYFKNSAGDYIGSIDFASIIKWDSTAPSGIIKLTKDGTSHDSFKGSIVSKRYFKEPVTFTVTTVDVGSGVNSTEYYISSNADSLPGSTEELENKVLDNWQSYNEEIQLSANGEHIIYVKITDNVGNVTYINTEKVEIEIDESTSVEVSGGNMVWLKTTIGGQSIWFGLDNNAGTFKSGAYFWVRGLDQNNDKAAWDRYYAQIDPQHQSKLEDGKLMLFNVGVTDKNGNDYGQLEAPADLYIQIPDDWDEADVKAIYVRDSDDETIRIPNIGHITHPEGNVRCAKLELNHFSPYLLYDEYTAEEKAADKAAAEDKTSQSDKKPGDDIKGTDDEDLTRNIDDIELNTSDNFSPIIPIIAAVIALAGVIIAFAGRRKK